MEVRGMCAGLVLAVCLAAGGCGSTPPSLKPKPGALSKVTLPNRTTQPSASQPSLQSRTLAEQSQRDVEAILKAREAKHENAVQMPPARPSIVWHERKSPSAPPN